MLKQIHPHKQFLFTIAFLFLPFKVAFSQTIVEFRYDRSGNIGMQDSVRISPSCPKCRRRER